MARPDDRWVGDAGADLRGEGGSEREIEGLDGVRGGQRALGSKSSNLRGSEGIRGFGSEGVRIQEPE